MKHKTYLPEEYYFTDSIFLKNFEKAIIVTSSTVGTYCNYYRMELITPKKGVKEKKKEGKLPAMGKKDFVRKLVKEIFRKSDFKDVFALFLNDKPISHNNKFEHHDETCCWALNLTENEFKDLQTQLKKNKLPADLFYDKARMRQKTVKSKTLFGLVGVTQYQTWSPKEWEAEKRGKAKYPDKGH